MASSDLDQELDFAGERIAREIIQAEKDKVKRAEEIAAKYHGQLIVPPAAHRCTPPPPNGITFVKIEPETIFQCSICDKKWILGRDSGEVWLRPWHKSHYTLRPLPFVLVTLTLTLVFGSFGGHISDVDFAINTAFILSCMASAWFQFWYWATRLWQ